MILNEDEQRRADANMKILHLLKVGAKVQAIYKDDENDPAFYPATVQEIVEPDEEGQKPRVVVTFDEYNNTECLVLGKIQLPAAVDPLISGGSGGGDEGRKERRSSRSRSREKDDRGSRRRSRSRSRERDTGDRDRRRSRSRDRARKSPPAPEGSGGGSLLASVMSKVAERDREKSAASGKDYAQRPASYKGSLSLKLDRFTHRKKSRSRSPERSRGGGRESQRDRRERDREDADKSNVYESGHRGHADDSKARYLKERYGDASEN